MLKNIDANQIINDIPAGILLWYEFNTGAKILCITEANNSLVELLVKKDLSVTSISALESKSDEYIRKYGQSFDYIIAIHVLEENASPVELLTAWKKLLNTNGTLLLGVENRLGLRYFCGDQDPFSHRNFDSIEKYRRIRPEDEQYIDGRLYSKNEIEDFLQKAGWSQYKLFSVLPGLEAPQMIYSETFLPTEELGIRLFPMYHNPDTVFLEEEYLYTSLIENGLFHQMANAYLIECSVNNCFTEVNQVTLSIDRGPQKALATIIWEDGKVQKKALYSEGEDGLDNLYRNMADLRNHGIHVLDDTYVNGVYTMPYTDAELASAYLRHLLFQNKEDFIVKMDEFRDIILRSSEIVQMSAEEAGVEHTESWIGTTSVLRKGYLDLVPLNAFFTNEGFVFFDQEFCQNNLPVKVLLTRLVDLTYQGDAQMELVLPRSFFIERYDLQDEIELWRRKEWNFICELRNEKELRVYHEKYRRNGETINTNRQRINYSTADYLRIFTDIFDGIDNKKLFLFGSGNFAKKFMNLYGKDYHVEAILDNQEAKWGQKLEDIPIVSPIVLEKLQTSEYKVIICIKSYVGVIRQLKELGTTNYAVYDTNMDYPRKRYTITGIKSIHKEESEIHKKYHIGYIAGVFDLFHVGHLNMFKRAKEQCEYLIVGVVTDEGVRNGKHTEPFIPFNERIEMVRSCKYVDEAVEIPQNYGGTRDAYRMYKFDVQFSGSDYVDNPDWLAEKEFLNKHGADLIFFPYTESTSSTKIKGLIEKKML